MDASKGKQPRSRGYGRRTALACLAAFAVSWLCAFKTWSVLPLFSWSSRPAVEPFSERFWFYAALAAAPLAAFAAAGLYCRLRARSCADAPRARRAAVHAPLACAAAWYVAPLIMATLSPGGDITWLENVLLCVSFQWGFMLYFVLAPLSTIAALGVLALAPAGGAAPEPGARQVARRSAAACLAALAFLLVFFIGAHSSLPELRYSEQPPLAIGDWALLVGVPLATFAAAGAYGWLQARSCGGGGRARAAAVLVPLASAAAWLVLPAAFWALMGTETGDSPAFYLLRSVDNWTDVPLSLLYLLLLSFVLFAVWVRAKTASDS